MRNLHFPAVSGKNLKRKRFNLPQDFPARQTLVLLAFWRQQQQDIDTWIPFATKLENTLPNFSYVELPVVYQMGKIRQFMLNEGMRAGIPDSAAREKTITLYLDKPRFFQQLEINSDNEIQILLVGPGGEILWRTTGLFSSKKGVSLKQTIQKIQPKSKNNKLTKELP